MNKTTKITEMREDTKQQRKNKKRKICFVRFSSTVVMFGLSVIELMIGQPYEKFLKRNYQ